jgi:hypothetical protein
MNQYEEESMDYERWLPELFVCPIFDGLTGEEIVSVLTDIAPEIIHYQKGDIILARGEPLRGFGVFLNTNPPQKPVRRKEKWRYPGVAKPGWIFAELPAFSDKPISVHHFPAPAECYVMFINADRFVFCQGENQKIHQQIIRNQFGVFARKCIALKRARQFFALGDIAENLAAFLRDEAQGAAPFLPRRDAEELAEMMMVDEAEIEAAYEKLIRQGRIIREENGFIKMTEA